MKAESRVTASHGIFENALTESQERGHENWFLVLCKIVDQDGFRAHWDRFIGNVVRARRKRNIDGRKVAQDGVRIQEIAVLKRARVEIAVGSVDFAAPGKSWPFLGIVEKAHGTVHWNVILLEKKPSVLVKDRGDQDECVRLKNARVARPILDVLGSDAMTHHDVALVKEASRPRVRNVAVGRCKRNVSGVNVVVKVRRSDTRPRGQGRCRKRRTGLKARAQFRARRTQKWIFLVGLVHIEGPMPPTIFKGADEFQDGVFIEIEHLEEERATTMPESISERSDVPQNRNAVDKGLLLRGAEHKDAFGKIADFGRGPSESVVESVLVKVALIMEAVLRFESSKRRNSMVHGALKGELLVLARSKAMRKFLDKRARPDDGAVFLVECASAHAFVGEKAVKLDGLGRVQDLSFFGLVVFKGSREIDDKSEGHLLVERARAVHLGVLEVPDVGIGRQIVQRVLRTFLRIQK